MKSIQTLSLVIVTATFFIFQCFGADFKPLTKAQAVQLLQIMGYKAVEIGAIVQQMGALAGAQNVATVIAIATRDGKTVKLEQGFFYDTEIGWFFHEFDDAGSSGLASPTKLRMWTLSGYKELRPKQLEAGLTPLVQTRSNRIVGKWNWGLTDGKVTQVTYIREDGSMESSNNSSGHWKCLDEREQLYESRWDVGGWVNRVRLSADGNMLVETVDGDRRERKRAN
jgi:hypothetical protein